MTTPNPSFNPVLTTNAAGSFNVSSEGYIQGTALDQPAIRNSLAGGILAPTETLPMWGGVGISETTTPIGTAITLPQGVLGGYITRATAVSAVPSVGAAGSLTGFSVFDQDHAMVNSPQSPVPVSGTYGQVNFYRLGSGARIAVAVDPALVTLEGNIITQQTSWDFVAQQLIPFVASYAANVITAASWAATGGGQVTFTTTTAHGVAVGADFEISGMVPAGYNGQFKAITGTAGSTLVAALAVNPGAETTNGTLVAGGGALNVDILDVQIGNSMTVSYNATTGFATWNRTGSCVIIQI